MSTYSTEHKLEKATVALLDKWLLTIDLKVDAVFRENKDLSVELDKLKEENQLKDELIETMKNKIGLFKKSKSNEKYSSCSYSAVLSRKRNEEPEIVMLSKVTKELSENNRIERNVVISGIKEKGANETEKIDNDIAAVVKVLSEIGLNRSSIKKQTRINKQMNHSKNKVPDLIVVEFHEK